MTSELQAAEAEIAEREKTINCTSLSASQMLGENVPEADEALERIMAEYSPSEWLEIKEYSMPSNIVCRLNKCGFTIIHTSKLEAERAKVKKLREALEYLLENVGLPPEANCSCHVNPPCHDCVDYGGLREALELSKAALKESQVNK